MFFSWFACFEDSAHPGREAGALAAADRKRLCELLSSAPGLLRAQIYTPAEAGGPFAGDGPPPRLALQVDFAELPSLESAVASDGTFAPLAVPSRWPSLAGTIVRHQAMLARVFAVPEPRPAHAADGACSYLVHYPGHAEDLNDWLRYYLAHHPRLMAGLPGVRAIEIFTRVDWCDGLPWRRADFFQRNKLVFDSAATLTAAMESPALQAMRADYRRFPPFAGGNLHYPMHTQVVMHADAGHEDPALDTLSGPVETDIHVRKSVPHRVS